MHINQVLQEDDITVITSSERVARELRSRRAMLKSLSGNEVWDDPAFIGPLKRFLTDAWLTLFDSRQLLHREQFLTLCKQAIDQSEHAGAAISSMALARTMAQAVRMRAEYRIKMDRQDYVFGSELIAFHDWHNALTDRLARDNYVLEHDLPDLITTALEQKDWTPPQRIVLIGFLRLTPQQQSWIDALRAAGTQVEEVDLPTLSVRTPRQFVAHAPQDEFRAAARWFRRNLLRQQSNGDQAPRMALIVPSLDKHRQAIAQAMEEEIAPHTFLAGLVGDSLENRRGFAFAGGERLTDFPWVHKVMDLLSLRAKRNDTEVLSRLLLSFAPPTETALRHQMAKLDLNLRNSAGWCLSGTLFVEMLREVRSQRTQRFAEGVEVFIEACNEMRLPSEWADIFESCIYNVGLLEDGILSRADQHQWWAFQEAMDILRTLDAQMGALPIEPAYRWLDEICSSRWHSDEHASAAPVQVLSPQEAVGLSFDHAWIANLHSREMPEQTTPNPFLPLNKQVAAKIPTACQQTNREIATDMLAALQNISPDMVLSHPTQAEGACLIPSGLVEWSRLSPVAQESELRESATYRSNIQLKAPTSDLFPPVDEEERDRLKRGVNIIQDQVQDPLAASLIHRLHLSEFPSINAGLTGAIQGQLIHEALRRFWSKTKTSAALGLLSDADLYEEVLQAVRGAFKAEKQCTAERYGRRLLTLEVMRCTDLVLAWLALEKDRDEPFEVVQCEVPMKVAIEGIEFDVRLDRVDRVWCKDGNVRNLIIDYKTGKLLDLGGLNAAKMKEPQLPIYATFADFSALGIVYPDGIALATVHPESLQFIARSSWTTELVPKTKNPGRTSDATWQGQLEAWRERIICEAHGFLEGGSEVFYRPHEYMGYHEHLAPLMRLGEIE